MVHVVAKVRLVASRHVHVHVHLLRRHRLLLFRRRSACKCIPPAHNCNDLCIVYRLTILVPPFVKELLRNHRRKMLPRRVSENHQVQRKEIVDTAYSEYLVHRSRSSSPVSLATRRHSGIERGRSCFVWVETLVVYQ